MRIKKYGSTEWFSLIREEFLNHELISIIDQYITKNHILITVLNLCYAIATLGGN